MVLPEEPLLAHFTLDENPTRALVFRLVVTVVLLVIAVWIAG